MRELERRYRRQPFKKEVKGLREAFRRISLKNLESMRRVDNRPSNIFYYEEIILREKREKELQNFPGKVIGSFCTFIPEELIYAAGAIPIRLCAGLYDAISIAEEVLPRDICPLVKSSFGLIVAEFSYIGLCHAIILPTPCDPKKKLGEILSDYLPVWILKIPQDKEFASSKELWFREINTLKERLEELTGNKITRRRLREAIESLHKRQRVFRRLYEIRKNNPGLMNGRDVELIIQSSFYDDIERWVEETEALCDQLTLVEERDNNNKRLRLLLTGAPIIWPNYKILNIIEELGAIIVADELCSATRALYDPVEVEEWTMEVMLRAISNRYLLPSTCPCFIESSDRIDRLLQMTKDFSCQGVVYHALRLCQLYDMEETRVRQVLREHGIPMLTLRTDYSEEDTEQIKIRVEAFLEMIGS